MNKSISQNSILALVIACLLVTSTCKKIEKSMLVSTGDVTGISTNSAEVSGMIIDIGGGADKHGHCYGKSPNISVNGSKTDLGSPSGSGGFTSQLSNLEAGTKYYVKAYIGNGSEIVYGKETSFTTTSPSLATIATAAVTSITTLTASSGGNITTDGGSPVTARGVCWHTSTGPSVINNKTTDGSGTGSFASSLTGLTAGTTYYLRAYATNSAGTSYGDELTFTSAAASLPSLTTTAVTAITQTTATGGGNVTSDGGASVTARGICWNTSTNPAITGSKTSDGTGTGSFSSNLTGLSAG